MTQVKWRKRHQHNGKTHSRRTMRLLLCSLLCMYPHYPFYRSRHHREYGKDIRYQRSPRLVTQLFTVHIFGCLTSPVTNCISDSFLLIVYPPALNVEQLNGVVLSFTLTILGRKGLKKRYLISSETQRTMFAYVVAV